MGGRRGYIPTMTIPEAMAAEPDQGDGLWNPDVPMVACPAEWTACTCKARHPTACVLVQYEILAGRLPSMAGCRRWRMSECADECVPSLGDMFRSVLLLGLSSKAHLSP